MKVTAFLLALAAVLVYIYGIAVDDFITGKIVEDERDEIKYTLIYIFETAVIFVLIAVVTDRE